MDLRDLAAIKAIRIVYAVIHRHRDLCQAAASIKRVGSDRFHIIRDRQLAADPAAPGEAVRRDDLDVC